MRSALLVCLSVVPLCGLPGPGTPAAGPQRSAVFLFGPAGAESARQAARTAAAVTHRWLSEPDSAAELRRAGSADTLPLDAKATVKTLEPLFLNAARGARDSDPETFINALDRAAQSLAGRPGLRILVAIVEQPPLSSDAEAQLRQTIQYCKSNSIRVVVLDPAEVPSKKPGGALKDLGESTGGALIRDPKALESSVLIASAGSKTAADAYAAPETEKPVIAANLPPMPSDLPVHTRFVRISPRGTESFGVQRSVGAGQGGISSTDTGVNTEDTTGPMRGLFLVESPNAALHFDVDDNAGAYTARARVTQIARSASGKIVWQASKPVTMHGPLKK